MLLERREMIGISLEKNPSTLDLFIQRNITYFLLLKYAVKFDN